jgi:hypothetical protein
MSEDAPQVGAVIRAKNVKKEKASIPFKPWNEIPELVEAKFEDLIKEHKQIQGEIKELSKRLEWVREEIQKHVEGKDYKVRAADYDSRWAPASYTEELDRKLMIADGVTPDQFAAWTRRKPRKAHLVIQKAGDDDTERGE